MPKKKNDPLFGDAGLAGTGQVDNSQYDPVSACLGKRAPRRKKVKAGYYLPQEVLEQLDEIYLRLRLKKEPVESKSQLVELALTMLFDDLASEENSQVLKNLRK